MHELLLFLHSLIRWFVLAGLIYTIFRAVRGITGGKEFLQIDDRSRNITVTIVHIQFFLGLILYITSPLTKFFFGNFQEAVKMGPVRFFAMEHTLMMLIAVALISIGSARSKKKVSDKDKFKSILIWFLIGLIVMLISIPWPFSPMASRPWLTLFGG